MAANMELGRDGARHFAAAMSQWSVAELAQLTDEVRGRPGMRFPPGRGLIELIEPVTSIAREVLGDGARPVRAMVFDKSAARNWAVGWHQDRTIAVRDRRDNPGFTKWTVKDGLVHVEPPFALLQRMLTLRLHLDPVGPDNAPLRIVPGSHRLGPIGEARIQAIVAAHGEATCRADAGDVWLYATPILHASHRATAPARRRVLQLLYSADLLPGGLCWLGV